MKRACIFLVLSGLLLVTGCNSTRPWFGRMDIYDTKADGEQQLATALAQARRDGKHVLLSLGANWCSDSQAMCRLLKTNREIHQFLAAHYVLAMVDANDRDTVPRNTNTLARFHEPLARGIPVLLVLNADGKLLNDDASERLADSDHDAPDRVLAYLRKWAPVAKP